MLETDAAVLIFVALPGVDAEKVDLAIRGGVLLISGERVLPDELRTAIIHRLELPQGRFERQHPAAGRPLWDAADRRGQRLPGDQAAQGIAAEDAAMSPPDVNPGAGAGQPTRAAAAPTR